jgi:hypothetical protein
MKRKLFFIMLLQLGVLKTFAHKEWVHQYMVRESYKMLKNTKGVNYNVFSDIQFGLNFWSGGGDYFGEGNPNDPWNTNSPIIVGVWREDKEDIVFGYDRFHCGDATNSHFWVADKGDNHQTHISIICNAYNSWQKARIMLFNGNNFELTLKKSGSFDYPIHLTSLATTLYTVNVSEFKIKYNSIFDLYNGNYKVEPIISNTDQIILNLFSNYSNGFDNASNWVEWKNEGKSVALQILGRVAHLLGDQSVPTHAHGIIHPCDIGDGDYYELDMGSSLTHSVCNTMPYNNGTCGCTAATWNANTAIAQGGLLDGILCLNDQDAMHYLFYSTNQLADFFPSGANSSFSHAYTAGYPMTFLSSGNNSHLTSDPTDNLITNFYTIFNNNSPGAVNTQQIGGITFNYAIRSVATLLYWFQTRLQDYQPTAYVQNANTLNNSSITTLAANVPGSIYVTNTNTKVYAHWGIEAGNNVTTAYSTGDFVVANGTAAKFLAGSSIHLQPGFKVEAGADFQAKIITFPCTGPSARQPNQEQFNDSDLIRLVHIGSDSIVHQNYTPLLADTKLSIFPNPFTQTTTLQFTNTANEEFTLDVFDITGRVVFTMQKITGTQYTFNRNNLTEGIYLLKLKSSTKSYIERLVVQN